MFNNIYISPPAHIRSRLGLHWLHEQVSRNWEVADCRWNVGCTLSCMMDRAFHKLDTNHTRAERRASSKVLRTNGRHRLVRSYLIPHTTQLHSLQAEHQGHEERVNGPDKLHSQGKVRTFCIMKGTYCSITSFRRSNFRAFCPISIQAEVPCLTIYWPGHDRKEHHPSSLPRRHEQHLPAAFPCCPA